MKSFVFVSRWVVLLVFFAGRLQSADVAPVDWKGVQLSQFSDEELRTGWKKRSLPYYLQHLSTVANSVVMEGPEAGWIGQHNWRSKEEFQGRDPRVSETFLAFVYFYTKKRDWNPYYGDPALRERVELTLRYTLAQLGENGLITHSAPVPSVGYRLASTMFLTKFLGEALKLLKDGPPIDPALHAAALTAQRRALGFIFTSDLAAAQGRQFSNQFGNAFSGAYAYLSLRDDPELETLFTRTITQTVPLMQSPAGYMYEDHSVDFGYTLSTHHTNIHSAWSNAEKTGRNVDWLKDETERWADWLSYNAVAEPDFSYFFLNRAIETRQSMAGFERIDAPFARDIPLLRAMVASSGEVATASQAERRRLAKNWPPSGTLKSSHDSYGPYAFLALSAFQWSPSTEEQEAARRTLPYLARDRFTHQRTDDRRRLEATFLRRPAYYAIFNAGESANSAQSFGLSLLWSPATGTVLQSQSRDATTAWATLMKGREEVEEHKGRDVLYFLDRKRFTPQTGPHDLEQGGLEIHYRIGKGGEKVLRFEDNRILVLVNPGGEFVEQIPVLLEPGLEPIVTPEQIRIPRSGGALLIIPEGQTGQDLIRTKTTIHGKKIAVVTLSGRSRLSYSLRFE